ncbi:MAG: hypothetical protein HUJ51_04260 [Eggerthellaceae bacterium]|nr:hypothetical protein [Eggerthellaceae bacterium]
MIKSYNKKQESSKNLDQEIDVASIYIGWKSKSYDIGLKYSKGDMRLSPSLAIFYQDIPIIYVVRLIRLRKKAKTSWALTIRLSRFMARTEVL